MSVLDLSSFLGLAATGLLTLNLLLGMLLGTAYKKRRLWQKLPERFKKIKVIYLHNLTAYVAFSLVLLHPLLLLLNPSTKFTLFDIFVPLQAPHQPLFVAVGSVAMYAVLLVVVSSQKSVRRRMAFRTWKTIHLISYCTAALFIVHGIVMDPLLKDRPVDLFDGEKLVSVFCGIVLLIATFLRYRYHLRSKKKHLKT